MKGCGVRTGSWARARQLGAMQQHGCGGLGARSAQRRCNRTKFIGNCTRERTELRMIVDQAEGYQQHMLPIGAREDAAHRPRGAKVLLSHRRSKATHGGSRLLLRASDPEDALPCIGRQCGRKQRRHGRKGNGRAQALTTLNQGLGRPHTVHENQSGSCEGNGPNKFLIGGICRAKFDWPGTSRPAIGWASRSAALGWASQSFSNPSETPSIRYVRCSANARTRPAPRSAPLPCCNKTAADDHSTALHGVCDAQNFWTAIHSRALRSCAAALLLVCTGSHVLTPPPHVYHHRSISLQLRWATAHATKRLRLASAGSGRRSARAACSASAGRCASAPSKRTGRPCGP